MGERKPKRASLAHRLTKRLFYLDLRIQQSGESALRHNVYFQRLGRDCRDTRDGEGGRQARHTWSSQGRVLLESQSTGIELRSTRRDRDRSARSTCAA